MKHKRLPARCVLWAALLAGGCDRGPDWIPRPDLSLVTERRLVEAVEAARGALERSPTSAAAWGRLGHIYLIHEWEAEAARCYRRAAEIEPQAFRWLYYLGRSLERTDPAAAADVLGRAISLEGGYAPAHVVNSRMLRNLGRFEEARQSLERAAELDPRNPYGELGLGQLALAAGRFEEAREHLRRALSLNPGQSEAHQAFAQLELALGDRNAAERHARAAVEPTQYLPMQDALWDEVEMAGVTKYWFAQRGNRFLRARDFARAVAELSQAVSPEERSPMLWYNYGAALLGAQRFDEAVATLERALAATEDEYYENTMGPESVLKIRNNLGLAYARLGDGARAEQHFKEALALDPASVEVMNNLAVLYYTQRRLSDAIDLLQSRENVRGEPRLNRVLNTILRERDSLASNRDE